MGIGNMSSGRIAPRSRPTHYPSWGLETRTDGRREAAKYQLITPHGDWKPTIHYYASQTFAGSLPLMGIGNPPSTTTRARRSQAHYPSWGLETCTLSASQALPYTLASLPLMGIGNRSDDLAGGEGRVAHYPSWGLETGCGPWGMG